VKRSGSRRHARGRERQASERRPESLTVGEALGRALELQRSGELGPAERLLSAVLRAEPENPDALHFLGVLRYQQARREEAIALIRRAVAISPDYADAHNNLGNILKVEGQREAAERAYRRTLEIAPGHPDALNNLGLLLKAADRLEEALEAFDRAIATAPRHTTAHYNRGNTLVYLGRHEEAVEAYRRAIEVFPGHYEALKSLGVELYRLGRIEEARETYRQLLAVDPDNPVAAHMLAACAGAASPARASDRYVRRVFDRMASTFDEHLEQLHYHAPALIAQALAREVGAAEAALDILDAGCGTGLCGPLLRPYARTLTGVDLSPGMLARARERKTYDRLVEHELTAYLEGNPAAFDALVSADTLVYFGVLKAVLGAASRALRSGGRLAFTVEALDDGEGGPGFRLNPHGRYSHAPEYLRRTLGGAGFVAVAIEPVHLRLERGVPVEGLLVTARRPADA